MPCAEPLLPLTVEKEDTTCKFCGEDAKDTCKNTCKDIFRTIYHVIGVCMCLSGAMIILFKFMELGIKYQN